MISQETINEMTRRLVKAYNPVKIYLFGSYAWGTPNEDSDVDFAIIVHEAHPRRVKRTLAASEALWGLGIPKDVIVYTKEEFARAAQHPSTLARKIVQEGRVLYGEASAMALRAIYC